GHSVALRVLSRVEVGGASVPHTGPPDPLAPLALTPAFSTPMYRVLAELSPELVLPGGAEAVPPDTISLVETNPAFVAAFMAGLNHEMQRELLWREYPSDPRGTPFRRFWDTRGTADPAPDVPPLRDWGTRALDRVLDQSPGGADSEQLVLLVRGELLRRYPGAVVYAVPARWTGVALPEGEVRQRREPHPDPAGELLPAFRGSLGPDLVLLGFDLDPGVARGSPDPAAAAPGWFLVIEQQPTEPRFGLDAVARAGAPAGWGDLAWAHVDVSPRGYLRVGAPGSVAAGAAGGPVWGATSAHMATITLRRPLRVAIHADAMIPES
ncbi:MAG TPA: hypothetical protein VFQ76_00060, partial [Longimicrobiaceae bacterium]|nr:hypothetical protein [Longimicrobiaceae bacterium]